MKQIAILSLFLCCVFAAKATDFWVNNLKYTVNADSCTVFVTKGISFEPYLAGGSDLVRHRIKEDSTHQPLYGDITIPESVSYQGKTYPVTVIGSYAFKDCKEITSVLLPESVETIEYNAFKDCKKITSIRIPESVGSIEYNAFIGCSSLRSVSIPSKVSKLASGTFEGCTSLTSISIPSTITKIEPYAFTGCSSLVRFDVAADNPNYSEVDGVLYTKDKKGLFLYPNAKSADVIIPSGVTAIGVGAFRLCDNLVSLKMPEGMLLIGSNAFEGCTRLTSISIPESVQFFGWNAFVGCTSLTSITIPSGIATLYPSTFAGCTALSRFVVSGEHKDFTVIDGVLFTKDRKTLVVYPYAKSNSYAIPDSVTFIEKYAFSECTRLTSLTIPEGVTILGEGAFSGCTNLSSINIPNSVTEIESYAFSNCSGLTSLTIPESVTTIWVYAFSGCNKLTSINIPNSVTEIERRIFSECTALTRFVVAKNHPTLSVVGGVLFSKDKTSLLCYPLGAKRKSYSIPSGVTDVADAAFSGCSHLTSLTISSPEYTQFSSAFNGTQSLKELHVRLEDPYDNLSGNITSLDLDRSRCVLYVPKGSRAAYQKDFFWKEFKHIVEE